MPKKRRHKMGIERPPETPPPPPSFFDPHRGLPREQASGAPPPSGEGQPAAGPGGVFWEQGAEQMFGRPVPVGRGAVKPEAPKIPTEQFIRPSVDVGKYFTLDKIFEHLGKIRKTAEWRPPTVAPITELAAPERDDFLRSLLVGRFFSLPDAEINRHGANAWRYYILPFLKRVEQALNIQKPEDLPGYFKFNFDNDGVFGLGYFEDK